MLTKEERRQIREDLYPCDDAIPLKHDDFLDLLDRIQIATSKKVNAQTRDWLNLHLMARPDRPTATMKFKDWVKLKKMLEAKEG